MASSLRLITSINLVTRSLLPTAVSVSRYLSIDRGHRSCTTMPINADFYYQSCVRMMSPKTSSMSFDMSMYGDRTQFTLDTGSEEKTDKGLLVILSTRGLKKEDLRACAEHNIQGKTHKESYLTGITLPEKTSSDTKEANMKDGILKESLPMMNILASDIIASFRDITTKRSWAYYDMFFDRSILVERFYPIIAMVSPINSFSIHKAETTRSLKIHMNMPGKQKMKLTTQGLRISLKMSRLKRRDIKTFFSYNTFFIEGKTKEPHYITCIHLPKGIRKKHNMIKRHVTNGVFYAIIPCYLKKEEIKIDQLKPITN